MPARAWRPDARTIEAWIGARALGWVAVLLLLFATAFFLKYAFDNSWIGEIGRVTLGALAGTGLCLVGFYYHQQGWRIFSQMLTSGGIVLLYLTTYGAFGYYHLLPQKQAAAFLIALIIESAALAALYKAPAIALMALVGGLLNPILLHTDVDQYLSFFTYLLVLNAGLSGLAFLKRWPAIATVALVGTQFLFWLWFEQNYHPEKRVAALGFETALFVLYLAYSIGPQWVQARRARVEDLIRLVLNAGFMALAGYVMLNADFHIWLGTLAICMAALHAALGWLSLAQRPANPMQQLVLVATGLAFVAAAIPLEASAAWIPVGWSVQGAALWLFATRTRTFALRCFGGGLLLWAVMRLVFVDTPYYGREPFIPLFNSYSLPACIVAACVLAVAAAASRSLRAPDERIAMYVNGVIGLLILWQIISIEAYTYFESRIVSYAADDVSSLRRSAQTALSVAWTVYAATLLALGFRLRSLRLRWAALIVFGVTLFKVVLVDMAELPGLYRVLAFFALALVMGGAAWGYQKYQLFRTGAEREVVT
jgi:uncharacterized membrane protein